MFRQGSPLSIPPRFSAAFSLSLALAYLLPYAQGYVSSLSHFDVPDRPVLELTNGSKNTSFNMVFDGAAVSFEAKALRALRVAFPGLNAR